MSTRCSLVLNGRSVRVATGDTPLEDALAEGMIAPLQGLHGAGLFGQAAAAAGRRGNGQRARRAEPVILSAPSGAPSLVPQNAAEPPPKPARRTGSLDEVAPLGREGLQIVVTLDKPLALDPGHQVILAPEGLPSFAACPSLRVNGSAELNELVFHLDGTENPGAEALVRSCHAGATPALAFKLKGPFGRGAYRPGGGRLVLVSSGTGFAAIWAIGRAARYIEPAREVCLVVGARDPLDLYMRPALDWLRATGVTRIVLASERGRQRPPDVRPGPLTAHVPQLRANDCVHVSGCASTVGAVEVLAASVGARCHPIPLDPAY